MTRRAWGLFIAMCLIWGIPYLLIKVAVRTISPPSLVFLRTGIGALLLLPLAMGRGDLRALMPRWRELIAYTAAEIAVPWLLLSDAERHLPSSLTGLLIAAVPIVGAVLAGLVREERLGLRRLIGLLIGLLGVATLLGLNAGGGYARSLAEVGVVVIGYAAGPLILSRRLRDLPGLGVVAASLALCAVGYAPAGLAQLPAYPPSAAVIASVIVLGVVCTALGFLVFFALIREAGPVRATVITYVNPAVAVALGVGVLGERFTATMTLGFALIIAGSLLATQAAESRGVSA